MKKITVLGAGPAGLSAAHYLTEKGCRCQVYEASDHVGGLSSTVSLWGGQYDLGPHSFLYTAPGPAAELWKQYAGEIRSFQLRRGMVMDGQLFRFPPSLAELIIYAPVFLFRSGFSFLFRNRSLEITNAGDVFRKKFGRFITRKIFNSYCEKYMGRSADQMDHVFAASLTSIKEGDGHIKVAPEVLYPVGSVGEVWNNLAEALSKQGTGIYLNHCLSRILVQSNRITGAEFSNGLTVQVDHLVSTLPLNVMLKLLPDVPDDILEIASQLRKRNTILVYLKTTGLHIPYHYITIFDDSIAAGRITFFSEWNGKNDGVICVEFWCDDNDGKWNTDNESLSELAVESLSKIARITDETVKDHHVIKLPGSYPVPVKGHKEGSVRIGNYLSRYSNLSLIGRHASFKWDGQDDNIMAALSLADTLSNDCI